ncbi:hypothetical protein LOTGIDRAFT_228346 [Lottia gigantea]|uniref:FZ domain-containing protein n=1 Tax=Lottia gigantea TaxID=225164 RepID=V4A1S3_LOTGI|nr:hypothetical protein LOTGIDRAFT_228346 [Lottia gigantea]ESO97783.1 hypothetical protein LOTGIDRAFT_228346 [Lottia gigantea]
MLALQLILAFSVAVGYVDMGLPPSVPPLQPSIPPIDEGCLPNMDCETTYQMAVISGDPCQAAKAFKTCAEASESLCTGPIPSLVSAFTEGAAKAVADNCNEVLENLPSCASICVPYEERAIGDWADNKQDEGCEQYLLYRSCLQNFEDSPSANCKVTNILSKALVTHNQKCPRTCPEYYDDCETNLPKLAADGKKLEETCLLWSACNGYDFTVCQKTLTVSYDTECANVTLLPSIDKDNNGVSIITSSMGMVIGTIGVLLLLIK